MPITTEEEPEDADEDAPSRVCVNIVLLTFGLISS